MNRKDYLQRLLITLPDGRFFNIMRNYLGRIKTPFHKPELINRLTAFLMKENVQERILQCIDNRDAEILSAIIFLDNPDVRRLFSFFVEQYDPFELHHHLINLEFRLLLFTDHKGGSANLICNPLLEERIRAEIFDQTVLFPSAPAADASLPLPWLQDILVTALLSFVGKASDILKTDGTLKKKTETDAQQVFPPLFETTPRGRKVDLLLEALERCGVLERTGSELHANWAAAFHLSTLSRRDRSFLLWSHTLPDSAPAGDKKMEAFARIIKLLPAGQLFTGDILQRIARAALIQSGLGEADPGVFIDTITALGILIPEGESYRRVDSLFPPEQTGELPVILQPNLHITMKPEIAYLQALVIAQASDILHGDVVYELEITKTSFYRHLENPGPIPPLLSLLNELQTPLPQPVSVLLREWEKEYGKIRLYEGVVIAVDPSLRHLVDHHPGLQKLMKAVISPGVYLFAKEESSLWKEAFIDAGIEHIPVAQAALKAERGETFPPDISGRPQNLDFLTPDFPSIQKMKRDPDLIRSELMRELQSMDISEEGREELSARISNRFILFPSQLSKDIEPRFKRTEAKGIDFVGKVRLIEQALSTGTDVLEIIERSAAGDPKRYIVTPVQLNRKGEQLLLMGKLLPGGESVQLQVRKLSLVRKMESILFTP